MDEQRAAFEHWYSDGEPSSRAIERSGDGYKLMQANGAWRVWQAATEQPRAEALSDESILRLICDNTGKRINLPNFTLYELIDFARALLSAQMDAPVRIDIERIKKSMATETIMVPEGLSREEKLKFILSHSDALIDPAPNGNAIPAQGTAKQEE